MKRFTLGLLLLLFLVGSTLARNESPIKRVVIDAHTHLSPWAVDRVKRIMDENGIEIMVNMSGGHFNRQMAGCLRMQKLLKGRVYNCYTPDWRHVDDPDFGWVEAEKLRYAVQRLGYKCLKISKALGLYVRDRNGVLIPINDDRFDPLWTEAGLLGVPVFQHVADPRAFFRPCTPDNERWKELQVHPYWCFYDRDYYTFEELHEQFEDELSRHPETVFIGVHFGNDAEDPDHVARMLDKYPNYYIDIAARVPEFGRHPASQMRKFFIKYQDRVMFATDIGIGTHNLMLGSSDGTVKTEEDAKWFYSQIYKYFESDLPEIDSPTPIQGDWKIHPVHLPRSVLEKIYRLNALRVLKIKEPKVQ